MPDLSSLLPEYQAIYNQLTPEIERSVRLATNARGVFNSGAPIELAEREKAKLLAELAKQSAASRISVGEAAKDRAATADQAAAQRAEARRAQNLNLLGSGFGALTTLGALKHMGGGKGGVGANIIPTEDGKFMTFDEATGTMREIPMAGAAETANPWYGDAPAAPSMWQKAKGAGAAGLGAAAAGGFAGAELAGLAAGRGSTAANVGSGVGAAAVPLAMLKMGYSNPWALGLGALGGSFGGGLLGNIFA